VNIQIEGTSEALDQRDCASAARCAGESRFFNQVRGSATVNNAKHPTHDPWTTAKQKAQRVREAQHPLAQGLFGKNLIDQQGRTLGHSPGTATGTEAPPLAAERQKVLGVTRFAPDSQKTMFESATFEVLVELALDRPRQCAPQCRQLSLERGIVVFDKLI